MPSFPFSPSCCPCMQVQIWVLAERMTSTNKLWGRGISSFSFVSQLEVTSPGTGSLEFSMDMQPCILFLWQNLQVLNVTTSCFVHVSKLPIKWERGRSAASTFKLTIKVTIRVGLNVSWGQSKEILRGQQLSIHFPHFQPRPLLTLVLNGQQLSDHGWPGLDN